MPISFKEGDKIKIRKECGVRKSSGVNDSTLTVLGTYKNQEGLYSCTGPTKPHIVLMADEMIPAEH